MYESGVRTSFNDQSDHILDLRDGLTYLRPRRDGIQLLKMIGMDKGTASSFKHEWVETKLSPRKETITLADGSTTTVNVVDADVYQINDLLRCEAEVMRVTAKTAGGTTITVVRGYAGTTGAAHTAKTMYNLGSAAPENSTGPAGRSNNVSRLYNYVQTFEEAVEMSNDEIAQRSASGNFFTKNMELRFIELMQRVSNSIFYGVRYEDTTNKLRVQGGLKGFLSTNVSNAGAAALTVALIDAQIKAIVDAGGDPKVLVVGTKQKQKLDALDASLVREGKREGVPGGNPMVSTWQSGILDHTIDILVDYTIADDELYILDTDNLAVKPLVGNGVDGNFHAVDATLPGQDGEKRVIRGKITFEVGLEAGQALIYNLA